MNKIDRKKFFGLMGGGLLLGSLFTSLPAKIFKGIAKNYSKNVSVKVHPDAVKRTSKV